MTHRYTYFLLPTPSFAFLFSLIFFIYHAYAMLSIFSRFFITIAGFSFVFVVLVELLLCDWSYVLMDNFMQTQWDNLPLYVPHIAKNLLLWLLSRNIGIYIFKFSSFFHYKCNDKTMYIQLLLDSTMNQIRREL